MLMTAKLTSVTQTLLLNFRLGYPTSYSMSLMEISGQPHKSKPECLLSSSP